VRCGRPLAIGVLTAAAVGLPFAALAQPAAQPPAKTALCVTCHGKLGMGATPDTPHIAGQPQIYLVAQLKAFRSGARKHEVMNVIAKSLSDEEIDALAAWYGGVHIEARPGP